jgi:hypothetical protein
MPKMSMNLCLTTLDQVAQKRVRPIPFPSKE